MNKPLLLAGAVFGAFVLSASAQAATNVTITLSESGYANATVSNPTDAFFTGSYGTFQVNSISGDLGSKNTVLTSLSSNIVATDGAPHDLTVTVDATGLTKYQNVSPDTFFKSSFTQNVLPEYWTVTEQTFINLGSGFVALTTPQVFSGLSTSGSITTPTFVPVFDDGYAVREVYTISTDGSAGTALSTIAISATPEPAAWALMMVGVGGMGAALRTRRRKASLTV